MFELYNVAIVPLIAGIVQLLKIYKMPSKYAPLASILLGLVFGIFFIGSNIREGIVVGLMLGLSATGLYSGGKHFMENYRKEPK